MTSPEARPREPETEADDREFRRDIDRWLDEGMTAEQYLTFRTHVARIREQAAAEARRELLAKVEQLDVDLLADAIVIAVRAERAPIGGRGDGWPAYSERGLPATVLNVSLLAKRLATEYRRLAAALPESEVPA